MDKRKAKCGQDCITQLDHILALRAMDAKINEERDRRYMEVDIEREKALKIKEVADLAALELAREIQTYKDEKANQLREQINNERGLYASKGELSSLAEKFEALMHPISAWMLAQQGRNQGLSDSAKILIGMIGVISTIFGIIGTILVIRNG